MKTPLLFVVVTLILLTGFFSYGGDITGEAVLRSSSLQARSGFGTTLENVEALPSSENWVGYEIRDTYGTSRISLVRRSPYGYRSTVRSTHPFTDYNPFPEPQGDVDCDGDVDKDDLISAQQAYQRFGGRARLDKSFDTIGGSYYSQKYIPADSSFECLQRADLNANNRLDFEDVRMLGSLVLGRGDKFSVSLVEQRKKCYVEDAETVIGGQKCVCKNQRYTSCEEPPAGFKWVDQPYDNPKLQFIYKG